MTDTNTNIKQQTTVKSTTMVKGAFLASIPLLLPAYILCQLLFIDKNNNPLKIIYTWLHQFIILTFTIQGGDDNSKTQSNDDVSGKFIDKAAMLSDSNPPPVPSQLLAYVIVSIFGYWATDRLIPIIKSYTLRKGISGKDLGKRGTELADKDV